MTTPTNDGGAEVPTGLDDETLTAKDMSYSPASETETAAKQDDPLPGALDDDIDPDDITVVPGTGGPDDVGDVDVDPGDLHLPHDTGAH
jgi:hypothetical protein